MNYTELSQQDINKSFLKACKNDDIELVKYLLTNHDLPLKAQLNINTQTGFANEKKEGMVPLIYAVQYNAKKVYKYFLEEIKWFSTLTQEGKLEVLSKGTYSNDIETIKYLWVKLEETTKINNYQKPFLLSRILDAVVDKNSNKVFDYLMTLPKEYKEHLNTKHDVALRRAAKSNSIMLEHMLSHNDYRELNTELYLACFEETQKNPESAVILFKYGIEKNLFDIWLTKYAQSYMRDKVKDNIFKTYHDGLIKYIHEEHIKKQYPEALFNLANQSPRDYFYTEDEFHKNKNNQHIAPVLEYAIKNKLLSKETRETIVFDIVKHDYRNLMEIISQYPEYGEGLDLNKAFITLLEKNNISKDKYEKIVKLLEIDIDKKIIVWAENFLFFKEMESIKTFSQNYDATVKKVFVEYYFLTDKNLEKIYANNPEMLQLLKMKDLNNRLSDENNENIKSEKKKTNKI